MQQTTSLNDLYIGQLRDLWSANDQMAKAVDEMASCVADDKLGSRLRASSEGIRQHTQLIRDLLDECGSNSSDEHCAGMEGLVAEARRHAIDAELAGPAKEVASIAQYQRMCHYGIAGFGTAKAYAEALGMDEHAHKLDDALERIYESDDYMSELAERSKNLEIRT